MDEAKTKIPQIKAEKKVGIDGLSKKERRALKVAQKTVNVDVINVKKETNNVKVKSTENEIKLENETGPSKAQLKAERRALQEKQRQLKDEAKNIKASLKEAPKKNQNEILDTKEKSEVKKDLKKELVKKPTSKQIDVNQIHSELDQDQVYLFNHLRFKSYPDEEKSRRNCCIEKGVHPTFIRLGVKYREKIICGSNSRGLGFLAALKDLIQDYEPSTNVEFCRGLENVLKIQLDYLQKCRPVSVSITNAYRQFKTVLNEIQTNDIIDSIEDKKDYLMRSIDMYIKDEIETAGQAISLTTQEKICNGDVIITFGCSSLIRTILCDAHDAGKRFHVIVLDAKPLLEGREMLRRLVCHGIDCTYELIHIVSHIMRRATKVLFGAHALLANGAVFSRAGTSQVALVAHKFRIPILVCCETYKFYEKVQMDCFVYNEIDDPNKVINTECPNDDNQCVLKNWKQKKFLKPLTLVYDITPPEFVTGVVTELGYLPSTSVPVVLRKKKIIT